MTNDIKLNLPEGVTELRIGELLKQTDRKPYSFTGNIQAPFEYFSNKFGLQPQQPDDKFGPWFGLFPMVVEVNRKALNIIFREDNHSDQGSAVVTGQLVLTPELQELGINAGKEYTGKQLSDTLKMKRLLFDSKDKNMELVKALQDFRAKVEADIQNANDDKGNKKFLFDQKIHQENDLRFTLNWPIISGMDKVKFQVEINYDVRASAIVFWLESVEMHESQMDQCEKCLNEEITKFKTAKVTVVTT